MSITDELREWGSRWEDIVALEIEEIANRIDAEHERMYTDLTIGMEPMDAEHMAEHGWVELPVDADGVPIHVGDEVKLEHNGRVTTVTNINYNEYGWQVYCAEGGGFDKDTRCRHVQPDSWERIIEDAAWYGKERQFVGTSGDCEHIAVLVERCKRLAGEA